MAGTGPELAKDPFQLINQEAREKPLLSKYFAPVVAGVIGVTAVAYGRYATKRPVFSGIHFYAIGGAVAVMAGLYIERYRDNYYAEKDAVIRHYMHLHPEDFPAYDRKKYSEVLEQWTPIR